MTRAPAALVSIRIKRLPAVHRIAHLRALIAREPACSVRRGELATILRHEMTSRPATESCIG